MEREDGVAAISEDVEFRITITNNSRADVNDIIVTDSYNQARLCCQTATPAPSTVDQTTRLPIWQ